MKAKSFWSKLAGTLALLCCLVMAVSCEKENVEYGFIFSSEGGPYVFIKELDGSSLMLTDGDGTSKNAVFYGSEADLEHSDWVIDLDWIRVSYLPTTHHVYVSTRKNETGAMRTARLTAEKKGKRFAVARFKQQ